MFRPWCLALWLVGLLSCGPLVGQSPTGALELSPADAPAGEPTPAPSPASPQLTPAAVDPALWLQSLPPRDVAIAAFQEITPGSTKLQEVEADLGPPRERTNVDGVIKLIYQIGPFPRVELTARDEVIVLIRAQLGTPRSLEELVQELDLQKFALTLDATVAGEPQMIVIPDRGLRLVLTDTTPPTANEIRLAVPTADDFVLRARSDDSLFFRQQLADLEQALKIQPGHAEALVGLSRIWERAGYAREARARLSASGRPAAGEAEATQPEASPLVRLELARLALRLGEFEPARTELQAVLPLLPETDHASRGRAELVLAELLSRQQPPTDSKAVLDQFFLAIQTSQKCLTEGAPRDAFEAHEVLLEAHLGAARYIARSSFRNKGETVAKWLANADALLRQDEAHDALLPLAKWSLWLATLECHVALGGSAESHEVATKLTQGGDRMLGQLQDDLAQRYVRSSYGYGLFLAARSVVLAGEGRPSAALAERAADMLASTAQQQPPHPASEAWLGQVYFHLGSLAAIAGRDHRAAMKWYDRALPLLDAHQQTLPELGPQHTAEQFVSIGLSYWETGSRSEALRWTERGLAVIQAGIEQGRCPASAQSIPCHNLAFMYDALGQTEKSQQMSELARRAGAEKPPEAR